jgi:hypothetical protein
MLNKLSPAQKPIVIMLIIVLVFFSFATMACDDGGSSNNCRNDGQMGQCYGGLEIDPCAEIIPGVNDKLCQ